MDTLDELRANGSGAERSFQRANSVSQASENSQTAQEYVPSMDAYIRHGLMRFT